jgi:hypothetical protein
MRFNWKNFLFRHYLKFSFSPDFSGQKSIRDQERILKGIIRALSGTEIGRDLKLSEIRSYADFSNKIPVTEYEFYEGYIEKIKRGEKNVMTRKPVRWFAKS